MKNFSETELQINEKHWTRKCSVLLHIWLLSLAAHYTMLWIVSSSKQYMYLESQTLLDSDYRNTALGQTRVPMAFSIETRG